MKNHVITVRLSENLKENLSDVADIQGITISEYIRQLIESRFVDAL